MIPRDGRRQSVAPPATSCRVARPSGAVSADLGLALQGSRPHDQARHDDPNVPEKRVWREASTPAAAFRRGNHAASPEMRLLMLCGRSDLPDAACESLRELLQAGMDIHGAGANETGAQTAQAPSGQAAEPRPPGYFPLQRPAGHLQAVNG